MPIERFTKSLQIPRLVHFTRAVNLPSIMAHGLYPIGRVDEVGANPDVNDHQRWDGHVDSTSVSITFPNSQMFFKCRKDNPEVDWAILLLCPSMLWTKRCAFSRYNAADGRIAAQPIENLTNLRAFESMFEPIEGHPSREDQRLKPFDPTDVQAEILVFDVIEPQFFRKVVFDSTSVRDTYKPALRDLETLVNTPNKGFFASRSYVR